MHIKNPVRTKSFRPLQCVLVFTATLASASAIAADQNVKFARDIQPLLAKHCLLCHGPDDAEGGLKLHTREGALAELDSGERGIVPGHASTSALLNRVTSDDPDVRMPPEGEGLSEKEIAVLRKWIEDGAKWETHWAYRRLADVSPPTASNTDAVQNNLDAFVVAKLEANGIAPSPEADRFTLIKRLYYDLVGLPPEPKDVDAFVNDASATAYENLVDQLLASPHFGERWGRHWLDKARYADSDGYEKDNHRPDAWRYRDWVIQAINDDMPFDQFTIEQLAGDMLPDSQPVQQLATAFNRQTLTNTEGGTDREQWRVAAVMDRTETLGTVWLGLSVGCARCHNHKYDQITQREYYQLYAYFNNGDETNTNVSKLSPFDSGSQKKIRDLKSNLAARRSELAATVPVWAAKLRAESDSTSNQPTQHHPLNVTVQGPDGVTFAAQDDGSVLVGGKNPDSAKYTITAKTGVKNITGIRIEVMPDDSLGGRGPGRTKHGNFVLNEVRFYTGKNEILDKTHRRTFVNAIADFAQDGWPVKHAIDGVEGPGRNGTGWAIGSQFGKAHHATFVLDGPIETDNHLQIVLSQTYGTQHSIGRFRVSVVTGKLPGASIPDDILSIVENNTRSEADTEKLITWYQTRDPASQQMQRDLTELRGETMTVRVINQRNSSPRTTHVLRRGEFKQPLGEVTTGTLATLPPIGSRDGNDRSDRLDLAHWLVDGQNPLVPRVIVNHVWKNLFGKGIVPTMNDFGVRGDPPSHPKLLDHLATLLIDSGWSRKRLIKSIVMSSTYRQSSRHRPKLVDVDPTNRLLHRQNRFRIEAEIIRDISLAVSGLLSPKMGGPSVFPPIPPGVTDLTYNSSFKWKTSGGEDRYRRGLYTYFKRTAPHPNLITFDCPDSNVTNVERDRSNTPIGALVTLNNATFTEAAQAMAHRVLANNDSDDRTKMTEALRRCIARVPNDEEVDDYLDLLNTSQTWYAANEDSAKELIGNRPAEGIAPADNAAWISVLRIMLNLDEFLTRE